MAPNFIEIEQELLAKRDPEKSEGLKRFFKTNKGDYGEGDIFIGLNMPCIRKIAKANYSLAFNDIKLLISNNIHEFRLTGFIILTYKFRKADKEEKKQICEFYLQNLDHCNNWDLVDCSASEILGNYLLEKETSILDQLAATNHLWRQRVSIIATYAFIRNNNFEASLRISKKLLHHKHDLIHKAVGWMLRECGNRNKEIELTFLKKHYKDMPRTMLRYAIEKFPEVERQAYLKGII